MSLIAFVLPLGALQTKVYAGISRSISRYFKVYCHGLTDYDIDVIVVIFLPVF